MLTVQVLGIYGSQVDLLGLGWRPVYLLTGLAGVAIAPLLACQGGPALQPPPVMTLCRGPARLQGRAGPGDEVSPDRCQG